MLVGLDTEYSFERVTEIRGRLHADVTTIQPVCACLVFGDGRELRLIDQWERLQELFDDRSYTFVVHGCHAEALFCAHVGVRFPERFIDTHLMALLVLHAETFRLPGGAYKHARLRDLAARFGIPFPWGHEKDPIRESIIHGTHVAEYGMDAVLQYCRDDAFAALRLEGPLRAEFASRCGPQAEKHLIELYQPYALHMAAAGRKGLRFDSEAWDRLLEFAPRCRHRLLVTMQRFGYSHDGSGLGDHGFRRMISTLGLEGAWPQTPTGRPSTTSDDLKTFRHQHPAIDAAYRLTNFDSFLSQDFGARVDRDGHLRCSILPLAQRTGRNSTSSPNLMGIPGEMRPLLLPDDGCRFLHFDFSQQEPGVAAYLSSDQALLRDFALGDVYINAGNRLGVIRTGMSLAQVKMLRNGLLKSLMLAIIYGKGAVSIARDIPCSYGEAVIHLHVFEQTYPVLFRWLRSYVAMSLERGWAENIIGFRGAFDISDPRERGHIARSCQNFPIQSAAAACFQLTGVYLAEFGADIRLPLHDAYLINVPDDARQIAEVRTWITAATEAATSQLFPGLAVKCEVEVLDRFAKDGRQDSFEKLISALEDEQCGDR